MADRFSATLAHLRSGSFTTHVDHNGDKLGTGRVVLLARALAATASPIAVLDLTWNFMGDQGAIELAAALPSLTGATVVKLPYNDIRADGIAAISLQLPLCPSLTLLDLGRNVIGGAGIIALAEALPHCSSLSTLILAAGEIGAFDVGVLFEALPRCSSLQSLNLESEYRLVDGVNAHDLRQQTLLVMVVLLQSLVFFRHARLCALSISP